MMKVVVTVLAENYKQEFTVREDDDDEDVSDIAMYIGDAIRTARRAVVV